MSIQHYLPAETETVGDGADAPPKLRTSITEHHRGRMITEPQGSCVFLMFGHVQVTSGQSADLELGMQNDERLGRLVALSPLLMIQKAIIDSNQFADKLRKEKSPNSCCFNFYSFPET